MASVIIEGGQNPIQEYSWQEMVMIGLLHGMAIERNRGKYKDDLILFVQSRWDGTYTERSQIAYNHSLTAEDIKDCLLDMIGKRWVEAAQLDCSCSDHKPSNLWEHARRFRLTKAGYDKVPEHIFP